jgi:hypothetical protein
MINENSVFLYFNGGSFEFFNVSSSSTQKYDENENDYFQKNDFFYATAIELAFSYSVCNGNNSYFVVDFALSNSFTSQCATINGFFYFIFLFIILFYF